MGKIYFEEELQMIKTEEVRNAVVEVLKQVNEEFYHAAASSTGKYHPNYALGDGGLYRHTKAAVKIANDILSLEYMSDDFAVEDKDCIIAALILHDTCKSGRNWDSKYTMHTHPIQAADLILEVTNNTVYEAIGVNIARLVSSHMGQWNEPGKWNKYDDRDVLPKPEKFDEFVVHLCDYLASRKYLEVAGVYETEEA